MNPASGVRLMERQYAIPHSKAKGGRFCLHGHARAKAYLKACKH